MFLINKITKNEGYILVLHIYATKLWDFIKQEDGIKVKRIQEIKIY